MATIRMVVEYDGTAFYGMQWQPNLRTISGTLETVLSTVFKEPIKITSAGRTDAGVHATGQVITFVTSRESFPWDRLAVALNTQLPDDLSVRDTCVMDDKFSARFSAIERSYVYALYASRQPSALLARYTARVWRPCDWKRFEAGAQHLLGEHDFRSFCGILPTSGPTIRNVREITLRECAGLQRVFVRADSFLHRMVRTIVGTLIECADGRRDPDSIPDILAARDRTRSGLTAPAQGLYLAGVRYPDGFDSFGEPPIFSSQ